MTTAAVVQKGDFTLPELVDLALCSPEVGAVNFNILRILLHNVIEKLGIVDQKATLNDVQAHQIDNFKNYIQGAGTASPMPGVLRYTNGPQTTDPAKTPRTPRQSPAANTQQSQMNTQQGGPNYTQSVGAVYTRHTTTKAQPGDSGREDQSSSFQSLEKKVARLERHLEALYSLPTNSRLLGDDDGSKKDNMSVNDMWQIIQLNNRVAAAEAAIQKMASLIEELAGQIKLLKNADKNASGFKKEFEKVARTSSNLAMQMEPCMEKCEQTAASLGRLKEDLEKIKKHLVGEIKKLSTAAGLAATSTPSFMGPRVSITDTLQAQRTSQSGGQQGQLTPISGAATSGQQRASDGSVIPGQQRGSDGSGIPGQQRASDGSGIPGQQRASDGSGIPGQQRASDGSVISGQQRASGGSQQRASDGSVILGEELGPDGTVISGQQRGSEGGASGQQRGSEGGASGQQRGSEGGASGHQRGSEGGASGQQRGSEGGASGQQRGSEGGASGQQRGSEGGASGEQRGSDASGISGQRVSDGGAQRTSLSSPHYDEFGTEGEEEADLNDEDVERDESGEEIPKEGRNSRIDSTDSDTFPTDEASGDGEQKQTATRGSQSDVDETHEKRSRTISEPTHRHQEISHVPVDVSGIPLETLEDKLDPFTDFVYPTILDDGTVVHGEMDGRYEQECRAQADLVQKELQEQYAKLQEMQRQMADEIQDKMELVYQKLLREISAQNATTSPYMAVGLNAEKCLGPGVCSGFGLPAGTAVCQFPQNPEKVDVCAKDGKVCPGKDVCPGREVCPTCKNDILHNLRTPAEKPRAAGQDYAKSGLSSSQENLLRQLTSMTLLPRDLEELRETLKERGTIPDVFDEADVLEKLQTLWEAVSVLKNNEENMAVRLIQQDAILKKIPDDAMEKLENLGTTPDDRLSHLGKGLKGMSQLGGEDLQLIFNNLSSLVLENAAMKEKLQKIYDTLFEFEHNVVTKPMLMNAMGDKADKGQMNTKVSYDEFGAGMDELQSRLGNLLQEVYRKNELWKEITDQMREDLSEKLDKVEIGPLRAYFKNHLGKLEEKVNHLTRILEEPDPAGTRKKLLRDYNCLSCDRHTNISGMTNAPLLPVLGPIYAGHTTTASKRAFELYRMRPKTSLYDGEGRNFCQMERQERGDGNNATGSSMPLNNSDMLHLVNRYVGGSHTAISTQDRIAALHKRASVNTSAGARTSVPPEVPRPKTSAGAPPAPGYFYEE